jgi:light-regulated signal transduction histidine kinase (bacteriophytochrome)/CheY-like chemotaxis protein
LDDSPHSPETTTSRIDLSNCDREPIHILGAIQPIGFLIAVTTDWIIARVSENISDFIGRSATEMIGRPLAEYLSPRALHDLRNRVGMLRTADSVERLFASEFIKDTPFDVAVHFSASYIIIEAEPGGDAPKDTTGTVRSMMARLDQTADFPAFYREGARQIRALLGYDRVMVYKFHPDGSGEVVGEACKSGIGSFKGLHYPATDIPQQARALYRRNLLRVICDVKSKPVKIIPQLDEFGHPLDLSLSMLRSVSPIHIEYLKNMGVGASMSISIIVDGELWGLFACHHYSARVPSFQARSVSELFAQMFAMRLESRERRAIVEYERRARDISDQLLGAVASDETLLKDPDWLADILTNTIPADGVGVWINGSYAFSGVTPSTELFRRIVRALNGTVAGKVFATDRLSSLLKIDNSEASLVAGLLAIPISRSPRDYVVLFRSEMIRSVRWAGDPHKPVEYGPNGPRLTPRESFEEWKELVEGQSQPFTTSELRVAETLRATLIEVVLRLADEAAAERHQASARQELLIAELNHRVRNILGVIRGLIRQSQHDDDEVGKFVKVVDGRIHALARAHNQITDDHWGPAPLQALIDAEAAAFHDGAQRIISSGPPILLNPQAYSAMALVVHELVTNSAKYGSLSNGGEAELSWHRNGNRDLVLNWRERGGPPVRAPERKGFGTTIIERSVPYDLGGSAEALFKEGGFEAHFTIPARHVSDPKTFAGPAIRFPRPTPHHPAEPPPKFLAERSVLLVEDSLIIALDAEDILIRLGSDGVVVHATIHGALDYLDNSTPSLAVLDINLGDRTSFPVADRLAELGVPFIFASGYGEQASLPMEHRGRQVLQKPYTLENMARALVELLGDAVWNRE